VRLAIGRRAAVLLVAALAGSFFIDAASARAASRSPAAAIAKWRATWQRVQSYQCTIRESERLGSRSEDRVYRLYFVKPRSTRMDVIAGDDRGSGAVWTGGSKVRGHRGGLLKGLVLTLDLHSRLVTSLRGTTIDQANFGALLRHFTGIKHSAIAATTDGVRTVVSQTVADPSSDDHVTSEVTILGKNGLPVEFDQFEGTSRVESFRYSDVRLNATIPPTTFSL